MADFEKLLENLKVWGKWGTDDERGALNYITDATRRDAARLVKSGRTFSLALPLAHGKGPQTGRGGRTNLLHFMTATGCDPTGLVELGAGARYTDDFIAMTVQASTQWDALCHIYYGETLYNGYPASSVSSTGADKNGIDKVHADFVSRGVLLDIARSKGVGCLDAGYAITTEDLEAAERAQEVRVEEGDILLIRTGQMSKIGEFEDWSVFHGLEAGLHFETAQWLHDRCVAAVAADNSMVEASKVLDDVMIPFHMLAICNLGIHLGEFWYMEDLAADCAQDKIYEFMLVAQGLPITGATGTPVNPLALK